MAYPRDPRRPSALIEALECELLVVPTLRLGYGLGGWGVATPLGAHFNLAGLRRQGIRPYLNTSHGKYPTRAPRAQN